jgi:predicted RNA-binding protein with PIN domain
VVFDRGLPGGHSRVLSGGRVEVVFAPTGRKADRVLKARIRRARDPAGLTVVTSDREVVATAQDRGARVVRAEAFVSELGAPPAPGAGGKADVHLSREEVEAWLELFNEDVS